ncbi:hypothetical protein [Owenweeksia hongkongensis]|uniref:DUF7660 family protein n=1 Tax=Owenweeksia hongkongensis TaxID=253245 RepID=UPI003A8CE600
MGANSNVYKFYETIKNKQDFEEFLSLLKKDFKDNPDTWENDRLELFLDGIYGYNFGTTDEEKDIKPTWSLFAEMLLAAKVFE